MKSIFEVLSGILNLGNIKFTGNFQNIISVNCLKIPLTCFLFGDMKIDVLIYHYIRNYN